MAWGWTQSGGGWRGTERGVWWGAGLDMEWGAWDRCRAGRGGAQLDMEWQRTVVGGGHGHRVQAFPIPCS